MRRRRGADLPGARLSGPAPSRSRAVERQSRIGLSFEPPHNLVTLAPLRQVPGRHDVCMLCRLHPRRSDFGLSIARRRMPMRLKVNGKEQELAAPNDMPLLWVLRDLLGLTGTKFGCGMAQCGACTVHHDGAPLRSCVTPVGAVAGKNITTIEGLSKDGSHPVQRAWAELDVVQCGYCQSGQIMSA